jgi:hypothetical protein
MIDRLFESLSNLGISGWAIGIVGGLLVGVLVVIGRNR